MTKRKQLFSLAVICLLLGGCAASTTTTGTTPAVPTPPQVTVTNAIAVVAQANDAMVHAVIAARDAGTVSQADCSTVESIATAVSNAGLAMNAELTSSDTWAAQKTKLIALLQAAGLYGLQSKISPALYAVVVALITAANQLSVSLGGPTI